MSVHTLTPGAIELAELRALARDDVRVVLAPGWLAHVERAVDAVRARLDAGEALYGINTGFGRLAKTRIEAEELGPAAAVHRALARGGRRRTAVRCGGAPRDGAEGGEPGARHVRACGRW